jgi:hypothetical protein
MRAYGTPSLRSRYILIDDAKVLFVEQGIFNCLPIDHRWFDRAASAQVSTLVAID